MDVARALGFSLPLASCLIMSACGYDMNNSTTGGQNKATGTCAGAAIPNKYIVHWKDGTKSVEYAHDDASIARNLIATNGSEIESVEHDFKVHIQGSASVGSDVAAQSTAALNNWGQERTFAPDAWTLAQGEGIVVAVVDTGIALDHPQLQNQLAVNAGEIPGNGVDDEKNGFVDDVNGYDFISGERSPNVVDNPNASHHGSHVSGIILAEHMADGSGIKGMAPKAKLLPLSFLDDKGGGSANDGIDAMNYAAARGAKIINASWGGLDCSNALTNAVNSMEAKGVLFIAAAGNGDDNTGIGFNLDVRKEYPAATGAAGQITVGAIDSLNYMTSFSNFSRNLVHIMAPGARIWSTVHDRGAADGGVNHGYQLMDGTSMATPFVVGAAAVVWSYRPKATVQQVKAALLAGVTAGNYAVVSGGLLNVRKALDEIAKHVDP